MPVLPGTRRGDGPVSSPGSASRPAACGFPESSPSSAGQRSLNSCCRLNDWTVWSLPVIGYGRTHPSPRRPRPMSDERDSPKQKTANLELAIAGIEERSTARAPSCGSRTGRACTRTSPPSGRALRLARPRHRDGHRRLPARAHRGDLRAEGRAARPTLTAARHRQRPAPGQDGRVHRRRARARPHLREEARRQETDELLISQPDYGEQALEIAVDMLVRSERGRPRGDRLRRRAPCPRPRSRATWATATSASRRG